MDISIAWRMDAGRLYNSVHSMLILLGMMQLFHRRMHYVLTELTLVLLRQKYILGLEFNSLNSSVF